LLVSSKLNYFGNNMKANLWVFFMIFLHAPLMIHSQEPISNEDSKTLVTDDPLIIQTLVVYDSPQEK
jgi:hypothetical protein